MQHAACDFSLSRRQVSRTISITSAAVVYRPQCAGMIDCRIALARWLLPVPALPSISSDSPAAGVTVEVLGVVAGRRSVRLADRRCRR
jgi:hypothetical protein